MTRTNPFGDTFSGSPSDFHEAYRAAMESVAAFDRRELCRIAASGRDREAFLQNMLSNDVKSLAVGSGVEATFLTNKGKLVSELVVYKEPERICLELERDRVAPLMSALDRYVISEDVGLVSLAETEARFSVEGPESASLLAGLTDAPAEKLGGLGDLQFLPCRAEGTPLVLIARRREPSARFDVVSAIEAAGAVLLRVLERGAVPAGEDVAETRRLEAGRPRFGVDMDDSHLPLEAGLDRAISYEKGCYIGQEYIVRLAHRGHLNRKLLGLRIEGEVAPARGSRVLLEGSSADVGEVTSSRFSPSAGSSLALAYLRREAFDPGTGVVVVSGEARRRATVAALPFIAP